MAVVITDAQIAQLRAVPKKLLNPRARPKQAERMILHDYQVESLDEQHAFSIYKRQNEIDPTDFSTGIRWHNGQTEVTLARYNGSSHEHTNVLEHETLSFVCHIHVATERYQAADRKPESYASESAAYSDLDGAFKQLLKDWNIPANPPSGGSGSTQTSLPL